ncbi:hypothetical protein CS533_07315 [Yersinia bercovieri]|uniref:Uncharacterized protein n=1 Tax=Yersinia bercovieri TaxID=634 RepID=A0A2G4U421_YERBE|nr:hypothetical protein [Yersinia bercovieri]PHZ28058.1 hypothetical protein CS533_07315 [Yersinia bercovieri]
MLLGDNERYIIKCQVNLKRFPDEAPNMPLSTCVPHLRALFLKDEVVYETNKGSSVIRILALQDEPSHLKLLFQYANKDASDPAFANLKTGATRIEKKQNDEGLGASAHLIIRKTPTDPAFPNSYTAILEEIPGITRGLVANAMTAFLKETGFSYQRKDSKKDLKCRPIVEIEFLASTTLEKSLSTGYLCGLTAIRYKKENSLDDDGLVKVDEEILKLSTVFKRGEGAIKAIKVAYDKLRGMHYSTLRISHRDENKRVTTDNVSIDKERSIEELATAQLAQRERIILATSIDVCQTTFHAELLGKMEAFMLK